MTAGDPQKKIWTILELLQWGTTYLNDKGFDEARLTVELLLAYSLQLSRIQLYTNFDRPLRESELSVFKALFQRRLQHEPVQYILGRTEFMGMEFEVDRRVLIPRPETEVLVEEAIHHIRENLGGKEVSVLDVGTGSGCIAVSLAKMAENCRVLAIDISGDALDLAKGNAARHGVGDRVTFQHLDILRIGKEGFAERFDMIVSNPPYISAEEFKSLDPEIRDYEPPPAATDGGDGLAFHRHIADNGQGWLLDGGSVIVEFAYNQSERVSRVFGEKGWQKCRVVKDYSGTPRCLFALHPGGAS